MDFFPCFNLSLTSLSLSFFYVTFFILDSGTINLGIVPYCVASQVVIKEIVSRQLSPVAPIPFPTNGTNQKQLHNGSFFPRLQVQDINQ